MADIKNLNIFGTKNKGLQEIKKASQQKKKAEQEIQDNHPPDIDTKVNVENKVEETKIEKIPQIEKPVVVEGQDIADTNIDTPSGQSTKPTAKRKNKKGAGAPIRNFDRVYVASQPVKLSAILNSTSRVLSEKYLAQHTRDEILRIALDFYIKVTFTKEDKRSLINDLTKEMSLYREKNPTIPQIDDNGEIIKSVEDIEQTTINELKNNWGISQ
ncbi:hypothetical protein HCA73_15910 [Listeria booriae]|uniref:hypothetical protein n=1 Tax=Listeria booriae TaxID=1552123 RepID=UPI0016287C2E|nr:hypothetical protein [Listeria booriae]MBC1914137.1 hypothetical protein [Listeria booriae]